MANNTIHDPFHRPTPYEILGVKKGVKATAKEIGKAYNKEKRGSEEEKGEEEKGRRGAKAARLPSGRPVR